MAEYAPGVGSCQLVDKFAQMRKNAYLYSGWLEMAETERSVLATPWWERRRPNPATLWQEVTT